MAPLARVTARLFQVVQAIGLATGEMLGVRLAERMGIHTSWMTILRRMMALPTVTVERVSQLGIDDFSFRRGRTFGTILVDIQSHEVIDFDKKACLMKHKRQMRERMSQVASTPKYRSLLILLDFTL